MEYLIYVAGISFAAVLIAAAAVYPFDPAKASEVLKKGIVTISAILILPFVIAHLFKAAWFLMLLILLLSSPIAYWLKETNSKNDKHQPSTRGAERTPVMPRQKEENL
jgi:hypothetical protein